MKKQLFNLIILLIFKLGYSQTFNSTDNNSNILEFNITSATTVEVKDYISGSAQVDIPTSVIYNNINYNVTSIGTLALANNSLTDIIIPNSVTVIGNNALRNNNLTSVTIPDSVITIGLASFGYNSSMISVQLSNNLANIPQQAFIGCDLQTLTIPDSVITIGQNAFANNNITSLLMGVNVVNIMQQAFRSNSISSLVIPNSVTSIGEAAFLFNPLTNIYSESTMPPTITTSSNVDTFALDRSTIDLHIPTGTTGAYVTDTGALWTGFNTVTEDALSVSDFELSNDIKVITSTDEIQVISSSNVRLENYTVYNLSGAQVDEGDTSIIAASTFANGIYILKLDFDKGTIIKKIIIK